jgi:ArsR family transcriptional regulator
MSEDNASRQDFCDCNIIHTDIVERVKRQMPEEEPIYEVADLFKVFGDSTRARIICALSISELCVCDLAALLDMSQSAVSHQLRTLKQARIVKNRRSGKVVYYSLDDEHIKELFNVAFDHVMED